MKTILLLAITLVLNATTAQARQYSTQISHIQSIQASHSGLNSLLQRDITIDTSAKILKVRLSQACTLSNICPEMLKFYKLEIKKMGAVIEAVGILPLQSGPMQTPTKVMITMEKNLDNATVIKIHDLSGTSVLIASPLKETNLLF